MAGGPPVSALRSSLRAAARRVLPLRLVGRGLGGGRVVLTVAMQRSGQHLVIDWLGRGLGRAVHFNHCWGRREGARFVVGPGRGRRVVYAGGAPVSDVFTEGDPTAGLEPPAGALVYSFEDYRLDAPELARLRRGGAEALLIVRDPYNWLASTLRHHAYSDAALARKVALWKETARQAVAGAAPVVRFDRFVADAEYRAERAAALGLTDPGAAEAALGAVPDFGGGSSFDRRRGGGDVLGRWRAAADDPRFRRLAADPELARLTRALGDPFDGFDAVLATLDLPC